MFKTVCSTAVIAGILALCGIFQPAMAEVRWLDPSELSRFDSSEIATIQRLLRRLKLLDDADMTRKADRRTTTALMAHLNGIGFDEQFTPDEVIRSLLRRAWVQEGWGEKKVEGQDVVVEPKEVSAAQRALLNLGYTPGPVDGIFGPATFSGVELFQEDSNMNVTGLLTRNTHQEILRREALRGNKLSSVVRVLNWPDYIDPDVLVQFEKQTGIRVVHEVFESSDETAALLLVGSDRYDVMVQSDVKMKELVDDGQALTPLDLSKLPNSKNLDELSLTYTAVLDPDNKHSLPYMWGTVGIATNETKINEIQRGLDLDSMSLFTDPDIAARLSKCGLAFVDEPGDVIPLLIAHFGGDLLNIKPEDIQKVDRAIARVADYIDLVSADRIIDDIAEEKYCVAIGYSGDVFLARDTAAENGLGKISYHVPSTGSLLWFDRFVIAKNARNRDAAYKFIDFMMRPKIAAANTNYLQYASPNVMAVKFVDEEIRNDPGVYPPPEVMKRLVFLYPDDSDEQTKAYSRIWSRMRRE